MSQRISPAISDSAPDLRIAFVLQPEFTLLAFSSFVDVLRHAADEADHSRQILCKWWLLGAGEETITASCGVGVRPDLPLAQASLAELDYVVVVGGLLSGGRLIDKAVYPFLHAAREAGVGIAALCTGFFHLARAGLLDGRRCCVPWMYEQHLAAEHPAVIAVPGPAYVEDDGIFTTLGGIAPLQLALDLVERHCGGRRFNKCVDRLCINSTFAPHRALSEMDDAFKVSGNRYLERAAEIMRSSASSSMGIAALARETGVSDRQLRTIFRRHTGKSPAQFWRDMRLHEAKWRLANGSQSITQIAYAMGFADSGHFSRSFRSRFGVTPHAYRRLRLNADLARPDE